MMACCSWCSCAFFAASSWRDAFVCIACLAMVCTERFAMCKSIVPAIVFAVLLSESLFVARPAKRLLWAYPLCVEVIVPDMRRCWYASWMKGRRLIHIWLPSGFCYQSSMSCWYRPHCVMRYREFWRSCWVVYRFCSRVTISWQSVNYLNRILGGSC
jgi:hypothetical protein